MRRAVLTHIKRSPFGKGRPGGLFDGCHPVDLYAQVIAQLVADARIDPALIDDVISGCVVQAGEQSGNIARQALLAAGLPESIPGVSIDRKCGSAQQAMDFAAQGIIADAYDIVVAGGVEMMSVVPMRANRLGKDHHGHGLRLRYPDGLVHQGISAELIAAQWHLPREALDAYALLSHQRAAEAEDAGLRLCDIVPISVPAADGTHIVDRDEGVRRDTSLERLAQLRPSFEDEAMKQRFPQIEWSITAGNSSQITDGASAALIMEESIAIRLGLTPRVAFSHFAVTGSDPIMMLTGVIPVTQKILDRSGMRIGDIDFYEVNEAFAPVPLAWLADIGGDPQRMNVQGGAIALGHPAGASGGRLMANLVSTLETRGGRYGLLTMCESGGMANATIVERC